jgi:hypothetical protein
MVLMNILKDLNQGGHKVLIFSKTKIFLNIIENIVSTLKILMVCRSNKILSTNTWD